MYRFLNALTQSPDGLLFDDPAASGATPPPAGATPPAAATPPPAGGTPPPAATPPPSFSYPEDRSNWVKPELHKRAESLINRTASENEALKRDLADRDRRIAALAGVTPPSPEQAESERIAAAFFALPQFAHLRGVTPEFIQNVNQMLSQGASFAEARDHQYEAQADQFLYGLDAAFAAEIGTDKLTPGQQRAVRAAFSAYIPDQRQHPEEFAAFDRRYNNPTEHQALIKEFMTQYAAEMLEPARRQATIPIAQRRPVPRGGPSAAVTTQANKPDYSKMGSVREMLDAAEKEAEALGR